MKSNPIIQAKAKTEQVKEELAIAGAELHLSNTALGRNLPDDQKNGDVGKALQQNVVVEERVAGAAEELHDVKELLEEEIAERHRLERELARRSPF
jgi:hypothetical protein